MLYLQLLYHKIESSRRPTLCVIVTASTIKYVRNALKMRGTYTCISLCKIKEPNDIHLKWLLHKNVHSIFFITSYNYNAFLLKQKSLFVYLFVCLFVCLFGVNRSTRKFLTDMETSPLQVKGCELWPMLDTHSRLAMMYL